MNSNRHPFHDLLAPRLTDWAPLYEQWEHLRAEVESLEAECHLELMTGDQCRRLRTLYRELALLRAEIEPTQPRERYLWSNAAVVTDTWREFVTHWRRLQRNAAWPIGPSAERLTDDERAAWKLLIRGRSANGVEKID